MAAADTIDAWDGPQILASWNSFVPETDPDTGETLDFLIEETSMVKTTDGSFWIAEIAGSGNTPQVRRVFSDGSQLVYEVADQISPQLQGIPFGVQDAILATDGETVWLVMLVNLDGFFADKSITCPTVPIERVRKLVSRNVGVAVFASSPPAGGGGAWGVDGDWFYVIGVDPAQTAQWGNGTPGDTDPPNTAYGNPSLPNPGNGWPPLALRFGLTACASPAEPGVLHFMWGEAGYSGDFDPCAYHDTGNGGGNYVCRLSYCRASGSSITDQFELFNSTVGWSDLGTGAGVPDVADACFCNALLRNDTGSPVAFVNMIGSYNASFINTPGGLIGKPYIEMWDLSLGSIDVILNSSLIVPPDFAGIGLDPRDFAVSDANDIYISGPPTEVRGAPLYNDPLLGGTPVYLLGVRYFTASTESLDWFILRVPADASGPFDWLDGSQAASIGIGQNAGVGDFVSETRNVWWPSGFSFGGLAPPVVMQYDRICSHGWIPDSESSRGEGVTNFRGIDLTGNLLSFVAGDPFNHLHSLTQQVILRNYYPCNTGMHVWEIV